MAGSDDWQFRSRRTLLRAIALLLIFAAAAKAIAVWRNPTEKLVLLPQVICEAALAGWLASGLRPRRALQTAMGVFALFACVALVELSLGKSSCGCFGPLQVPPAVTFMMDLGVVVLLILQSADEPFLGGTFFVRLIFATCALMVGLAAFAVAWERHQERSPRPVEVFPGAAALQ